ncbi:helix-turn-helix domain-containing protein [Halorussus sp. AFM4]|uniref:helix-turn-helix domain-containing protein n=1 Tax=Halorussus sp. AFM4 TaxID=3421651 RepID=UPI003EBDA46D
MSLIAEFSLRSPELALASALDAAPEVTVELERQLAADPDAPLMTFWAAGGDLDRLEAGLDGDETVREHAVVEELGGRRLFRARLDVDRLRPVYPVYQRLGASPLAATGSTDGWNRRVRFPDRDSVVEMRRACLEMDVEFRLHRLYTPGAGSIEDEYGLSPEQRRALETAERIGYFEVPRDAGLDDLGAELDISGQSASERVRRGVSELVSNTLLSDL